MYKLLLILKYLRKRRIAWVSLAAVMLCTTMVIVVISVMGGWLRMFRESFHGLSGDIIVESRSLTGFPHYQEIIERISALPEVEAAVPTIRSFGLIDVRNYIYEIREGVQVIGYPIDEIGKVNQFSKSLYRQYELPRNVLADPNANLTAEERELAQRWMNAGPSFDLLPNINYERAAPRAPNPRNWPGMIVGAGVVGIHKDREGNIVRPPGLYEAWATLTVLEMRADTSVVDAGSKKAQPFWIVDDSRTQIYQYDGNTAYVPFDVLQNMLGMDIEGEPKRASTIEINVRDQFDMYAVLPKIEQIVADVFDAHGIIGMPALVQTWEQSQAVWIGAIEKEKMLVTMLFGIISIVAIFLIFCIFYMIVVEKTRDIGIIKSVGATGGGVAGIFLGYGLAIGLVGAACGFGAGFLIVRNINELHTWMGKALGVQIWNPEVYAFDTIPNTMNPTEVAWILAIAVIASVLGSLVPAIRAARMHPVEALRWE